MKYYIFLFIIATQIAFSQWESCTDSLGVLNITSLLVKGNHIYAGTNVNGILFSPDNGISWEKKNDGIECLFISSVGLNGNELLVGTSCYSPPGIYYSSNNGNSWELRTSGIYNTSLSIGGFVFIDTAIFVGTYGRGVYKSTDKGLSWKSKNFGLQHLGVTSILNIDTVIFATEWGGYGISYSTDFGNSWASRNSGLVNNFVRVIKTSGSLLFAGPADLGVYVSSDMGNTWHPKNNGLINRNLYSLAFTNKYVFAGLCENGGLFGGIYISSNNGENWYPLNDGLKNHNVYAIAVNDSFVFAGTDKGLLRMKINDILISSVPLDVGLKNEIQITPNPCIDYINVKVNNNIWADNKEWNINIYNAIGYCVYKDVANDKNKMNFALSHLCQGVYLIVIQDGSKTLSSSFVKM